MIECLRLVRLFLRLGKNRRIIMLMSIITEIGKATPIRVPCKTITTTLPEPTPKKATTTFKKKEGLPITLTNNKTKTKNRSTPGKPVTSLKKPETNETNMKNEEKKYNDRNWNERRRKRLIWRSTSRLSLILMLVWPSLRRKLWLRMGTRKMMVSLL